MVTTASAEAAERVRTASLHGLSRNAWSRYSETKAVDYEVAIAGFKYNMTDIQAALGLEQLRRMHAMQARREAIWRAYQEAFAHLPVRLPAETPAHATHARHLYTVLIDERESGLGRDVVAERLSAEGVGTAIHFRALHLHRFYAERFGLRRGMFPNAEFVSDRTLSLPLSAAMTDEEVDRVIDAVRGIWS
jgi:dTDP-4-amino-4,6-dideoxygalactose transaminase